MCLHMMLLNKNHIDMCANMKISFNHYENKHSLTKLGHGYKITNPRITTWVK